jgi:hypothetical protein
MWAAFFKFILDNFPAIAVIVVVIGITIFFCYKYFKIMARIIKIEEQREDCTTKIFPKLDTRLDKINESLYSIRTSLSSLATYLKIKDSNVDVSLFTTHSPIVLSRFGERILNEIGGKKIIDDNYPFFLMEIDKEKFKTGLDAHNFCINLIMNEFNDDKFIPVREYLFNKPIYKFTNNDGIETEYHLDVNDVYTVLGIYLRDKFFESHADLLYLWENPPAPQKV